MSKSTHRTDKPGAVQLIEQELGQVGGASSSQSTGTWTRLQGDYNRDGDVDGRDFLIWRKSGELAT